MNFVSRDHLLLFLSNLSFVGMGSQGECFLDRRNNKVYKIFHQYLDDLEDDWKINYSKDNLLKFSNIENNTFVWPSDVIMVDNEIVCYVCEYVNGVSLFRMNPLSVNLDKFSNDIYSVNKDLLIISNNGVRTFDMMYNTIYNNCGFKIIDQDDYSFSDLSCDQLYSLNKNNFDYEIFCFLVDNYFDEFISDTNELKTMYCNKEIDVLDFIKVFRKYLSEYVGYNINTLRDAKVCLNKNSSKIKYLRDIR